MTTLVQIEIFQQLLNLVQISKMPRILMTLVTFHSGPSSGQDLNFFKTLVYNQVQANFIFHSTFKFHRR